MLSSLAFCFSRSWNPQVNCVILHGAAAWAESRCVVRYWIGVFTTSRLRRNDLKTIAQTFYETIKVGSIQDKEILPEVEQIITEKS